MIFKQKSAGSKLNVMLLIILILLVLLLPVLHFYYPAHHTRGVGASSDSSDLILGAYVEVLSEEGSGDGDSDGKGEREKIQNLKEQEAGAMRK